MKKYALVKYDFIEVEGKKLFRIRALRDFGNVKEGDLGGYIENDCNLNHCGNCWVYDNAIVYDDAELHDNAKVYGYAEVCGSVKIYGPAEINGNALIK